MENSFRVSMTFGEKAIYQIKNSALPDNVLNAVNSAKKYVEGKTIQIPVKNDSDVQSVKSLIEIKLSN